MKILLVHNYYQQTGGEDQSFEDEARLLEANGHAVVRFTLHNNSIEQLGRARLATRTLWNSKVYRQLRDLIRAERPRIMHCTNVFPLVSPAAYYAAKAERVPVVQSLRNYRLLCANSLFLRDNKTCEKCLHRRIAWPALWHRCYRGQLGATAVVATMLATHRALGTWQRAVNLFVTPSEFARRKYIAGGFDAKRIVVKPNFVYPDPGVGSGASHCAVFAGRLSHEKGIEVLLEAWQRHKLNLPLRIIGDGPLADRVREACKQCDKIEWLGYLPPDQTLARIGEAALLISPSITFETFGRSVVEAFAKGTPVLTADTSASADLVTPLINGAHFHTGDAADLAARVRELSDDPSRLSRMREPARQEYLHKYTGEQNYQMLMAIYDRAMSLAKPADRVPFLVALLGKLTSILP